MKGGLIIEPEDNVVVVTEDVRIGDTVSYKLDGTYYEIQAKQDIPVYHKIARAGIENGDKVIKYGQIIGVAVADINEGDHVHVHNVRSMSKEVE